MKIYQVYDSEDMAETDSYFATLREAIFAIRNYGILGPIKPVNGSWVGSIADGYEVHLERHEITPTRAGICAAMKWIPNR